MALNRYRIAIRDNMDKTFVIRDKNGNLCGVLLFEDNGKLEAFITGSATIEKKEKVTEKGEEKKW